MKSREDIEALVQLTALGITASDNTDIETKAALQAEFTVLMWILENPAVPQVLKERIEALDAHVTKAKELFAVQPPFNYETFFGKKKEVQ